MKPLPQHVQPELASVPIEDLVSISESFSGRVVSPEEALLVAGSGSKIIWRPNNLPCCVILSEETPS